MIRRTLFMARNGAVKDVVRKVVVLLSNKLKNHEQSQKPDDHQRTEWPQKINSGGLNGLHHLFQTLILVSARITIRFSTKNAATTKQAGMNIGLSITSSK